MSAVLRLPRQDRAAGASVRAVDAAGRAAVPDVL